MTNQRSTTDETLTVYDDGPVQRARLASALTDLAVDGTPLRLLEAGCGHRWALDVGDTELHITGIDLDAEAMRIRRETHGDLDVEIVGDLRSVDLTDGSFDAVYCSFVLEHIEGAEMVLDRLVAATRPGGRIVLRIPDGRTIYGLAVRFTPFRVHVWYRRYVAGHRQAGQPGHAPYPTYYDNVVSLAGMRDYARRNNLKIVAIFGSNQYLKAFRGARRLVASLLRGAGRLTGGRFPGTHNNLAIVFERRSAS